MFEFLLFVMLGALVLLALTAISALRPVPRDGVGEILSRESMEYWRQHGTED